MSTTMRVFLAVAVAAGAVALAGCNVNDYYGGLADDLNSYVERERNERGAFAAEFQRFRDNNFNDLPQRRPDAPPKSPRRWVWGSAASARSVESTDTP